MTETSRAVFLSYASQDGEAARRICDALRAAGVEVWFDRSELRGGDAWDQKIRRQIRDCALFIPIISANTASRLEGYFRLEWDLADRRTHMIAHNKPFIVPVSVGSVPSAAADVPESFLRVQWTPLPEGEAAAHALAERISRLVSPDGGHPSAAISGADSAFAANYVRPSKATPINLALLLIVLAAVLGAGYLALDKLVLSRRSTDVARKAATAGSTAPVRTSVPEKSIAVLPFVDMSEKKDQEYFSDGLAEELLNLLAQVPDLKVPARTSSFYFKGKQVTVAEIATALGVAHVLEGSVRKAGQMIRVTVQLIRADNGYQVWSKTYDRDFKDIFKVQDEIAGAVVEMLKAKLAPPHSVASYRTSNTEAYTQYLLARHFHLRGNTEGFRRAVESYRKAIVLDPGYAAAYSGLAVSEAVLADITGDAALLKQAEADADKGVELGPEAADAYSARGDIRATFSWDWAGAQSDFEKALLLDPADTTVQLRYGNLMVYLRRLPEAIAAEKRAVELDPLASTAWGTLGRCLMYSGDYPGAAKALHRALEIQPEYANTLYDLARLQLLQGSAAEALATFGKVDDAALRLSGISMAEYALGHAKESQQFLDELIAKEAQDAAAQIAGVFAWRRENDKAFEWLERAYRQRDGGLSEVKSDPLLANIRSDPRYVAFLGKMKLD
jgi:TolB-like protein/Tfp pilus assembly protein PilF